MSECVWPECDCPRSLPSSPCWRNTAWAKQALAADEPTLLAGSVKVLTETRKILDVIDRQKTIEEWARAHRNVRADICGNLHGDAPPKPPFHAVLDEMRAIHDAKNTDYADSEDRFANFRESEEVGIPAYVGAFIRTGDKYRRARNLIRREQAGGAGPAVATESVEDTLIDLAVYSIIVLLLYREREQKEQGK